NSPFENLSRSRARWLRRSRRCLSRDKMCERNFRFSAKNRRRSSISAKYASAASTTSANRNALRSERDSSSIGDRTRSKSSRPISRFNSSMLVTGPAGGAGGEEIVGFGGGSHRALRRGRKASARGSRRARAAHPRREDGREPVQQP